MNTMIKLAIEHAVSVIWLRKLSGALPRYVRPCNCSLSITEKVRACTRPFEPALTVNQRVALRVFVFNVGCGAWLRSTARKLLDAGLLASVPDAMRRYTKIRAADGQLIESRGLFNRRLKEARFWECGNVKICKLVDGETK